MKRIIVLFIFIMMICSFFVSVNADVEAGVLNIFKDINWGYSMEQVLSVVPWSDPEVDSGKITYLTYRDMDYLFCGDNAQTVQFGFIDDGLRYITFYYFSVGSVYESLIQKLKTEYGKENSFRNTLRNSDKGEFTWNLSDGTMVSIRPITSKGGAVLTFKNASNNDLKSKNIDKKDYGGLALTGATTDKCITFLNIPWLSRESDAEALIMQQFPDINNRYHEDCPSLMYKSSYSFSDGAKKYLPYYESENVETRIIYYKKDERISFGKVAGYPINGIFLRFIATESYYGLFEATYQFATLDNNSSISIQEEYMDLKRKLSDLYGIPYVCELGDSLLGSREGEVSVWIGADGSGVNLQYEKYLDGYVKAREFIDLKYGTTAVNNIFINADIAAEKEKERKYQEDREKVKDDSTGL